MTLTTSGLPVRRAEERRSPADPCHTAVRTGPNVAVRVGRVSNIDQRRKAERLGRHWRAHSSAAGAFYSVLVYRLARLFHAFFRSRLAAIALALSLDLHLHQVGQRTIT